MWIAAKTTPKPYCSLLFHLNFSTAEYPRYTVAMAKKPVEESDVGINCYVSSLPGFRAILKQRYADFIVHEVDSNMNIVRLTSFDIPVEDNEEKEEEENDKKSADQSFRKEIEAFRMIAGEKDAEMLEGFLKTIRNDADNNSEGPKLIILSPAADKAHRAELHNFFKKNFKFLITDTVEESNDIKCVRVRFCLGGGDSRSQCGKKRKGRGGKSSNNDRPFDSRGSDNWPEHLGKFLRFNLWKENKDTQDALGVIGKMLGTQVRSFGFAGTKDKRSISTQRVTVFKQRVKKLASLNNRLFGIKVGDFSYVNEGLLLGQLFGNHFTITLRGVVADSEDNVRAATEGLGRNGFINYFGLQRFGSGSIPTHLIGAALLRGEWEDASKLILGPRDGERYEVREIREYFKKTGDIDKTLRDLPRYLVAERSMLQCLKKCPGNFLQALRAIPRTLRMMYVHSYQSYLWNHAATMRVRKYGTAQVVLGDLVYSKDSPTEKLVQRDTDIPVDDSICCMDEISESALSAEDIHLVKVINSDDILEGFYNFNDIVLPLPGSRVIYPENEVADVYRELAEKGITYLMNNSDGAWLLASDMPLVFVMIRTVFEAMPLVSFLSSTTRSSTIRLTSLGVSLDSTDSISLYETVHGAKEFSLTSMTGAYRKVFQRPIDFTWELISYSDSTIPLAETDFDAISKAKGCNNQQEYNGNGKKDISCSLEGVDDPKVQPFVDSNALPAQVALKLGFTLPSSCYATMAIRELLKTSTSVAYHKSLDV